MSEVSLRSGQAGAREETAKRPETRVFNEDRTHDRPSGDGLSAISGAGH